MALTSLYIFTLSDPAKLLLTHTASASINPLESFAALSLISVLLTLFTYEWTDQ